MDQEDTRRLIESLGYAVQEVEKRLYVLEADLRRVENDLEEFSTSVVPNTPIGSTSHGSRTKDAKGTSTTKATQKWWICPRCKRKDIPVADAAIIHKILDSAPDRKTEEGNYISAKPCPDCEQADAGADRL